ncbi:unnamed protein product [Lathyrus sativus]|nr:unnamed protein product [Lathyrus sativus]
MCNLLLCFILLVRVVSYTTHAIKIPPNASFPAVFAFGDSIMDTGNNNNNMKALAKCNFPPYGKDFKGGIPTGRFCNGKVPSDFLAEVYGIKELLPAYLDPNIQPNDLITGVCFASGGAGYDALTSQLAAVISLSRQIELFKEYIEKLKGIVGVDRANFIIEHSIYLVVDGSNDISNTYFLSHVRELQYDVPAYADLMLNAATNFITEIYKLGARKIGVFSAPPIGCVPFQRTLAGGIERKCAEKINDLCKIFNTKLSKELSSLNHNLVNSRIVYLDVYTPLLDIIVNHQSYGYKVGDKGCCGTGEVEASMLCNQFSTTCENANDYVFWDSFHPTESVYMKLVDSLNKKYLHQFL